MTAAELTCAQVDAQDLDLRYLAGRLTDQEADAFEAHLTTCQRCWALVEQGANVRAVRLPDTAVVQLPDAAVVRLAPRHARRRLAMALAAGLAVVAFGLWQRGHRTPADELRGDADTLSLRVEPVTIALRVSWHPVGQAGRYRVRLHLPDGGLLVERETGDTTFAVLRDSLPPGSRQTDLFWLVEALSPTGAVLARSGLVAQPLPLSAP